MASLYCRGDATKEHCRRSLCPSVTCVLLLYPRVGEACGRNTVHWGVRCTGERSLPEVRMARACLSNSFWPCRSLRSAKPDRNERRYLAR